MYTFNTNQHSTHTFTHKATCTDNKKAQKCRTDDLRSQQVNDCY